MWIKIKLIILTYVSKALLGYTIENKELGLLDVSCLYPGGEIEKYKLEMSATFLMLKTTGRQKSVWKTVIVTSCCIEMHIGFLDIPLDILVSLKKFLRGWFGLVSHWRLWLEIVSGFSAVALSRRRKGELVTPRKNFTHYINDTQADKFLKST